MMRAGWMNGLMLFGTALLCAVGAQAQTQTRVTIVALGASNTEGWGVVASEAYPRKLQALLNARNINATVINAGVAGDTTGGMLCKELREDGVHFTPAAYAILAERILPEVLAALGK